MLLRYVLGQENRVPRGSASVLLELFCYSCLAQHLCLKKDTALAKFGESKKNGVKKGEVRNRCVGAIFVICLWMFDR